MTTRRAALGLASLIGGLWLVAAADGSGRLAGAALVLAGVVTVAVALLRGISDSTEATVRAAAAEQHRAAADGDHLETRSETGRWPPVIGGG